jgi:hypothetical protein
MADLPLATFKDLSLDATDSSRLGPFWAAALALTWHPPASSEQVGRLTGPTPQHTIWLAEVPEPKTVKQRVHLDIYTEALADLEALGATVVEPQHGDRRWTVMADVEGGEFCAFLRDELPPDRLHGVVVDSTDPHAQAEWWGAAYGAEIVHHDDGYSTVEQVPGMPILTMDFVPVPEPKAVKNRIHWDVIGDADGLLAAGATLLRCADDEIRWTVLADPEGNEFCVFSPGS